MNERKFNYDTLPSNDEFPTGLRAADQVVHDGRYAPFPCYYCMNQSNGMIGAQRIYANPYAWQRPNSSVDVNFHELAMLYPNGNLRGRMNRGQGQNVGNVMQASAHLNEGALSENHMLQQFLTEDGQVDVQKMLQTIGQFANTVQQVSPVIKQINDLVKSFRT